MVDLVCDGLSKLNIIWWRLKSAHPHEPQECIFSDLDTHDGLFNARISILSFSPQAPDNIVIMTMSKISIDCISKLESKCYRFMDKVKHVHIRPLIDMNYQPSEPRINPNENPISAWEISVQPGITFPPIPKFLRQYYKRYTRPQAVVKNTCGITIDEMCRCRYDV